MDIDFLFENEHFVAVDKPAAVLTVPGRQGKEDPRPCLANILRTRLAIDLWPVHRLDYEVSGLVVFAKSAKAHRDSNTWFEERLIHKSYEAWSAGYVADETQSRQPLKWKSNLLRGKRRAYESPHGKPSVTRATWLGQLRWRELDVNSWCLEPLTGRSHQLRFEMSRHGYPILGDELYGSAADFIAPDTIALRAVELDLSDCSGAKQYGLPERITAPGLVKLYGEDKKR